MRREKKKWRVEKRHSNVKCVLIILGAAPKWATETQKFAQMTCSLIWGYIKCSKRSCILNESLEKEWRRNLSQSFSSPIFDWTKYPVQGANSLILWPLGEGEARTRALGHYLVSKSIKMGDLIWVGRSARDKGGSLRGFKGSTMFASQYRGFGASGHVMEIHVPGQGGIFSKVSQITWRTACSTKLKDRLQDHEGRQRQEQRNKKRVFTNRLCPVKIRKVKYNIIWTPFSTNVVLYSKWQKQ